MKPLLLALLLVSSLPVNASEKIVGDFTIKSTTDEMSGVKRFTAMTDFSPSPELDSPYKGVKSALFIGCDTKRKKISVSMFFSKRPNIVNDETRDGYSSSVSRIKFDDKLDNIALMQVHGSSFLFARNADFAVKNIKNKKTVKLEIDWYGNGSPIFEYKVGGAKDAIKEISKSCGIS